MAEAFSVSRVWMTLVEVRVITEEGLYADGQVPTDYGGAELKVEVVQRVILTDPAGHVTELRMDNISTVMDKDKKAGVGVTIPSVFADGTPTVVAPVGPSAFSVTWIKRENPLLSAAEKAKAAQMYAIYLNQLDT